MYVPLFVGPPRPSPQSPHADPQAVKVGDKVLNLIGLQTVEAKAVPLKSFLCISSTADAVRKIEAQLLGCPSTNLLGR
jgi:hypothetical protein